MIPFLFVWLGWGLAGWSLSLSLSAIACRGGKDFNRSFLIYGVLLPYIQRGWVLIAMGPASFIDVAMALHSIWKMRTMNLGNIVIPPARMVKVTEVWIYNDDGTVEEDDG